ncbi:MAG: tetratricopeptide repeat protein [Chlorobiaceae bacterium]|nr:tetratricopeptide repeat protein [Chlorobiaceae bacterium]
MIDNRFEQAVELHRQGQFHQAQSIYEEILETAPAHVETLNLLGILAAQTQEHRRAVELIDRAIAIFPHHADSHFNRGQALQALGQWDDAAASFDMAIALKPDYVDAWLNRGNAKLRLKAWAAALASYEKVIGLQPDHAEAWANRGLVLHELKEWDAALVSYDKATGLNPDYAEAWLNRGNTLLELREREAAIASYDRATEINPGFIEAWYNRGRTLMELKAWDAAVASYDRLTAINPDFIEAWYNRGLAMKALGRLEEALASYDRLIALDSVLADAWFNRALVLQEMKRLEEAVESYNRVIVIKPDYAEAWSNRGVALKELKQLDAALASYDNAISFKPDYPEAWYNRGNALIELKQFHTALDSYDRATALRSDYANANWNKSIVLLSEGDYLKGWELYEWRWRADGFPSPERDFRRPLWLGGESINGKTILLHSEQGLGDTIQFSRYVNLVAALGARVVLEADPPVIGLLRQLEGVAEFVVKGDRFPWFDLHCPLMSLPLAFKTTLETIPSASGYLSSEPTKLDEWSRRLGGKAKPRIGLAWSGRPQHQNDHNRSLPLALLVQLLPPGFQYVSLQKEINEVDWPTLDSQTEIVYYGDDLKDFTDTAALCELMDVVVSVDTSVAHLGAAMGRPTMVMLPFIPDWRWLLDRNDSPWYDSVRLYRQEIQGDWTGVLTRLSADLLKQSW